MLNYKPLRHTLINKELKITNVCRELDISPSIRTKLNQDQPVSLGTIVKLCNYLDVPIEKVVEVRENSK